MENRKAVFHLPNEKAALNPRALMGDEKGIYFSFMSDMGIIASLVPPPLEPFSPFVSGYIVHIRKPTFSEEYYDAMMGVYVMLGDTVGMYPITFLLSVAGAEMATYLGRDKTGLPKKMCEREDCISLKAEGDVVRGIVERKGVRLMDVSIKLGEYNNPITDQLYFSPCPGKRTSGISFYFTSNMAPDVEGNSQFCNINLLSNVAEYTYKDWIPGKVSIRLQSSKDDAWGQLPVLEAMGGGYSTNDLEMKELRVVATPEAEIVMPYLLSSRFDRLGLK